MHFGPSNPDDPTEHIYKIERHDGPGDPDYDNWPSEYGAPADKDGNPLSLGDQTLWTAFNDADTLIHNTPGTLPLGIDVQQTVWASDDADSEVVYLKYKLYNHGTNQIHDFYISFWADPDIGDAMDDLVGCSEEHNLAFCYNYGFDDIYGRVPPAWGAKLLSGPVVVSPGDTAEFDGRPMPGYRNLGLSSICNYVNGEDPSEAEHYYNIARGLTKYGNVYVDCDGHPTLYPNDGYPPGNLGCIDDNASDKRLILNMGPLDFMPGDSQQVMFKLASTAYDDALGSVRQLLMQLDSTSVPNLSTLVAADSAYLEVQNYGLPQDWYWSSDDERWFEGYNWGATLVEGGVGPACWTAYGSLLCPETDPEKMRAVEIRFSNSGNTQKGYCYQQGGSVDGRCAGYFDVPFTAWDTDNNRQLNVGFVEQISYCIDSTWGPCGTGSGGKEYLFVFDSDYSPDTTNNPYHYQDRVILKDADSLDAVYFIWLRMRSNHSLSELADGQTLGFWSQNVNPNGRPDTLFLNSITAGRYKYQDLHIRAFSSDSSVVYFVNDKPNVFSVSPNRLQFIGNLDTTVRVSFHPPQPGNYDDRLVLVDSVSREVLYGVILRGDAASMTTAQTLLEPDTVHISWAQNTAPESVPLFIYLGNLNSGGAGDQIDPSSIKVNGITPAQYTWLLPSYPGFDGPVLKAQVWSEYMLPYYTPALGNGPRSYWVSGGLTTGGGFWAEGSFFLVGHRVGDVNADGLVNVSDAVSLVSYIFADGPAPEPLLAADANCDGTANITDVTYIVNYIFAGGPPPCEP